LAQIFSFHNWNKLDGCQTLVKNIGWANQNIGGVKGGKK